MNIYYTVSIYISDCLVSKRRRFESLSEAFGVAFPIAIQVGIEDRKRLSLPWSGPPKQVQIERITKKEIENYIEVFRFPPFDKHDTDLFKFWAKEVYEAFNEGIII